MSLAEGVSARVAYKFYATGAITPGSEPAPGTDPGAASAQILRRTAANLSLAKDTFQSNEIASTRQISDFRHGMRRVNGQIQGELSCATYADFLEALFRGTWAASAISASEVDFTSATADNASSKFTFAAGDPVTKGFRVGDVMRFASLSVGANNAQNFVITAFGGTSNREVTVHPAPTDMTADTAFTVVSVGRSLIVPSSSHVSRKLAVEVWNEDIDIARLFTECRVGSGKINLPAQGMATAEFGLMGRNVETYTGGSAPFFSSPTAATATGILAAANGLLLVNGTAQAVVTGIEIGIDLSPSSEPVVGSNLVPEIFLGRAKVSGQVTAFFEDATLINNFVDEDEVSILCYLTATNAANAPAMTFFLPRVKFGGADTPAQGEGGQTITLPFQALLYAGATAGVEATTIRITDTEVS